MNISKYFLVVDNADLYDSVRIKMFYNKNNLRHPRLNIV